MFPPLLALTSAHGWNALWGDCGVRPSYGTVVTVSTNVDGHGLRGILAAKQLARGTELARIPLAAAITVPRASADDGALARRLIQAVAKDTRGPWRTYAAQALGWPAEDGSSHPPLESPGAAMFWSKAEVAELQYPAAIELVSKLRRRIASLRAPAGSTAAEWAWALAVVHSRSFVLSRSGEAGGAERELRALVPFADLLNHESEPPWRYAAEAQAWEAQGCDEPPQPWRVDGEDIVVSAAYPCVSGGEVRVPYGLEGNAELLASHGFILEPNDAEYVTLFDSPAQLVASRRDLSEMQISKRLALLEAADAAEAPLAARPAPLGRSRHLLSSCALLVATDVEADAFEDLFDAEAGHFVLSPPAWLRPERKRELEAAAQQLARSVALEELADFPTRYEQDEQQLRDLVAPGGTGLCSTNEEKMKVTARARAQTALRYRLGLKRLLRDFAKICGETETADTAT